MTRPTPPSTILANSQFAPLEPCWAGISGPTQLKGLLAFASLFNEVLDIHDTQLGDNPHLVASFVRKAQQTNGLYEFLLQLIQHRIVRIAIRDITFVPSKGLTIPCESLSDVLNSWNQQGMSGAWVSREGKSETAEMLKTIDRSLDEGNHLRYDYLKVKAGFIRRVRDVMLGGTSLPAELDLGRLEPKVRQQYEEIAGRNWFSHSDIFALLREAGISLQDPLAQIHGFFDESAYADWHSANLAGSDAVTLASPEQHEDRPNPLGRGDELLNSAVRRMPSIGLDVLATISIEELLHLRSLARGLFATQRFLRERSSLAEVEPVLRNYVEAFAAFWQQVCDYLVETRPELLKERTKLGIFTQRQLPTLSDLTYKYSSMTINLGLDVLTLFFPTLKDADAEQRKRIIDKFTLQFLLLAESDHTRDMRRTLPRHVWIDKDRRY
jgi:hypothetical protein